MLRFLVGALSVGWLPVLGFLLVLVVGVGGLQNREHAWCRFVKNDNRQSQIYAIGMAVRLDVRSRTDIEGRAGSRIWGMSTCHSGSSFVGFFVEEKCAPPYQGMHRSLKAPTPSGTTPQYSEPGSKCAYSCYRCFTGAWGRRLGYQ